MDNKWQIVLMKMEQLFTDVGLTLPPFPRPPESGPVGQEWADPWRRESIYLDWLNTALTMLGGEESKPQKPRKAA